MSFYLFIAISFYLNIVCKNIVCELGLKVANCPNFADCKGVSKNATRQPWKEGRCLTPNSDASTPPPSGGSTAGLPNILSNY